jgi:hypothetical protein
MTRTQRTQVRHTLRETATAIRAIKVLQRASGQPAWTSTAAYELMKLQSRVTVLAALVARQRMRAFEQSGLLVRTWKWMTNRDPKPHVQHFPFMLGNAACVTSHASWEHILDREEETLDLTLLHASADPLMKRSMPHA